MKPIKLAAFVSGLSLAAGGAHAQAVTCGETYTVRAGDYLTLIADRAYGDTSSFSLIYSANSEIIGPNPGEIRIGQRLFIPCLNAPVAASTANASAITRTDTTDAVPAPAEIPPIRVLTATGWPPFMDEDQEQGGLLTEIINLALAASDGSPEYKIDFINDDGAHLNPLIVDHAYDISIGWSQPNCADTSNMEDESLFRCNNLLFSEPMYEEVLGYYSLASEPVVTEHAALKGKRICRADAFTLAPLEEVGLVEPDITIVRAPDAPTCIDYLLDGSVDVALVAVEVAEGRINALSASDDIQLNEKLTYVDVLHAVIANTHPRSEEILASVNDGLKEIKDSGVWFQTVRRHMTAFRNANK